MDFSTKTVDISLSTTDLAKIYADNGWMWEGTANGVPTAQEIGKFLARLRRDFDRRDNRKFISSGRIEIRQIDENEVQYALIFAHDDGPEN